jgi:L-alanine-DL-glutamate epimerase-like enolase superfamily enzyme
VLEINPQSLVTVATIGMGTPGEMAAKARAFAAYPQLKVKLDGHQPLERLSAIRKARPEATLVVDVNQGWSMAELASYTPELSNLGVAMIEQPLARGADAELEGYHSPIPLGADESCLDLSDYEEAAARDRHARSRRGKRSDGGKHDWDVTGYGAKPRHWPILSVRRYRWTAVAGIRHRRWP